MPDHFHLLITVDSGTSIERAVQFVKGGFAFRACKEFGMRAPVWQKGFSDIRVWGPGPDEFQRIRTYIHNNPIKEGLADQAEQYPYSSAHGGFELDAAPITLDPKLLTAVLHVERELPDKATKRAFLSAIREWVNRARGFASKCVAFSSKLPRLRLPPPFAIFEGWYSIHKLRNRTALSNSRALTRHFIRPIIRPRHLLNSGRGVRFRG